MKGEPNVSLICCFIIFCFESDISFFGSAKVLVKGEPNVSYICSRYYRAPELIFGATDYTPDIGKFGNLGKELVL